jgi:two-component system sensor histidine kinase KdpD
MTQLLHPHGYVHTKTHGALAWLGTGVALAVATLVTLAFKAWAFSEANLVMIYLLAVVFVGVRFGALRSTVAAVAAVLLFDVLFTRPYYALTVHDTEYLITFSVMLAAGFFASSLTSRIHHQAEAARRNERRANSLYRLNQRLAALSGTPRLVEHAEEAVSEMFEAHAVIYLADHQGKVRPGVDHMASFAADASELSAAQRVCENQRAAGLGTAEFPAIGSLYVPLTTPNRTVGVLAVQPEDPAAIQTPDSRQLLDTCAAQIALALERDMLAEESQEARVQVETEKLRSSLLSAVSHDLRTPLAGIAGAGSSLAESFELLDEATRQELVETICDESARLSRLVENLLNMTRLSAGRIDIDKQWHPVDEVVGSALSRLQQHLGEREVRIGISEDLPLGHFDAVLIEQVLINLIENAAKYSPPASAISVEAEPVVDGIELRVLDRGIGLLPGDEERVFEMFYRGADVRLDHRGTGLGLAICKAVVDAHGGRIGATIREDGGTLVWLQLPHDGSPPQIDMDRSMR